MTYRLITLSIFSLGLVYYYWLGIPAVNKQAPVSPTSNMHVALPDAWMESVDATFMNKAGQVLMKIRSPTVKHYAQDDTTHLTTPEFLLYRDHANPWRIQAGAGTATRGMDNIRLSRLVTLHYPGDAHQPVTWINTDKLTIHPEQKTADTAEQVVFTQPHLTMRGKGLHADWQTGDINLLAETRGEYAFNQ